MKQYEALVMTRLELPPETREFEQIAEKLGAKIKGRTELGKRRLGYIVKKVREALVASVDFELDPAQVKELKHSLMLSENILKFNIIRKPILQRQAKARRKLDKMARREPVRAKSH